MDTQEKLLQRRIETILPDKDSFLALLNKNQITVYQGFDPSKPDLHIGHLVGLMQLRVLQDLGHKVVFLIGDFTGMIGDPTDKSATRPKLTREEVVENAKTYKAQASKILRFEGDNPAEIRYNSTWLDQLTFADVLELSSNVTVQQLMERDMFKKRIEDQKPIHLHEFMYPLLQGYDSVAMEVDLEIGGNDQLFNMMMGRHLLKALKDKEKYVMTLKLITDAQGRKIGKTTGNAVNLFGDPNDAYGQLMAFPDESIITAMTLATNLSIEQIDAYAEQIETDPMNVKKALAFEIVSLCHGKEVAQVAAEHFQATVQNKEVPQDIPELTLYSDTKILDLLEMAGFGESNGERKRVIKQGGVTIDGTKVADSNQIVSPAQHGIIKYGKRAYVQIKG